MSTAVKKEPAVVPAVAAVEPSGIRPRVVVALVAAVLVLTAATVVLAVRMVGAYSDDSRDAVVLAYARDTARTLLTINQGDAKGPMAALMDGASGDFKQQLIAQSDEFTAAVHDAKVSSEATITESGIQAVNDEQASVLVTATATVKNGNSPAGEQKQYRIVMELVRPPDAPWSVSKLDFAP